jgi:hypothetical protein
MPCLQQAFLVFLYHTDYATNLMRAKPAALGNFRRLKPDLNHGVPPSMWICGGSFGSWLKKYNRNAPIRITVGKVKIPDPQLADQPSVFHFHQRFTLANAFVG